MKWGLNGTLMLLVYELVNHNALESSINSPKIYHVSPQRALSRSDWRFHVKCSKRRATNRPPDEVAKRRRKVNLVFVSGLVMNKPSYDETHSHTTFKINIRHRTKSGEIRTEVYPVSAWHECARRTDQNLHAGQLVAVRGYLTQKKDHSIEICAEEVIPSRIVLHSPSDPSASE